MSIRIFLPSMAEMLRVEPTGGASQSAGDGSPHWRGRVPPSDGPCDFQPQPGRGRPPPLTYGWDGTPCNAWGRGKREMGWDRRREWGKYLVEMVKITSFLKKGQEKNETSQSHIISSMSISLCYSTYCKYCCMLLLLTCRPDRQWMQRQPPAQRWRRAPPLQHEMAWTLQGQTQPDTQRTSICPLSEHRMDSQ